VPGRLAEGKNEKSKWDSRSFAMCMQRVAASCVWLAAKLEEALSPRRTKDVLNVFHRIEQRREGLVPEHLDYYSKVLLAPISSYLHLCKTFPLFKTLPYLERIPGSVASLQFEDTLVPGMVFSDLSSLACIDMVTGAMSPSAPLDCLLLSAEV
jgi:hypothetical protein